jgi:extracellular elastinolytic metalloproteinase
MGEAWSDWYALDLLAREGNVTDSAAAGDVVEGEYVDGGNLLIRTQAIDCPPQDNGGSPNCAGFVETGPGGYTYGDFGKIVVGQPGGAPVPEVHADGEIWAQTLWQLRAALIARYGAQEGSDRAERYVTGGMRLGPAQPSYLDQRNAILQADTVAGGADQDLIWSVFASRGMGYYASTTGAYDFQPQEDFQLPPAPGGPTGTVTGVVRNDLGQRVAGVRVGLSGHDGPPAAGPALQAVTGADGRYTISGVPQATYPQLVAHAPSGYADAFGGQATVTNTLDRDLVLRRNWADVDAGATIATDARDDSAWGCGPRNLADGDEATVVETAAPHDTTFRTFTVQLPQAIDGAEVAIDPSAGCGLLQSSALKDYVVQVQAAGQPFQTVATGSFDRTSLGHLNRVPAQGVPNGVTAVRLVARSTQQFLLSDNDTLTIAELQVYSRPNVAPEATPTPTPTATPTVTATPLAGLAPRLGSNARRVSLSKSGRVTVRVKCVTTGSGTRPKRCVGTLRLTARIKGRTRTIAAGVFAFDSSKTLKQALKLGRRARKVLRSRALKVTVHARTADGTAKRTITIRRRR